MACEHSKDIVTIVRGNTFKIALPLQRLVVSSSGEVVEDYTPADDDVVTISLVERRTYTYTPTIEGNIARFAIGGDVACGVYGIEVIVVKADGERLRSYRLRQLAVVENNERAGIVPSSTEFGIEGVTLDAAVTYSVDALADVDYTLNAETMELVLSPSNGGDDEFDFVSADELDERLKDYPTKQDVKKAKGGQGSVLWEVHKKCMPFNAQYGHLYSGKIPTIKAAPRGAIIVRPDDLTREDNGDFVLDISKFGDDAGKVIKSVPNDEKAMFCHYHYDYDIDWENKKVVFDSGSILGEYSTKYAGADDGDIEAQFLLYANVLRFAYISKDGTPHQTDDLSTFSLKPERKLGIDKKWLYGHISSIFKIGSHPSDENWKGNSAAANDVGEVSFIKAEDGWEVEVWKRINRKNGRSDGALPQKVISKWVGAEVHDWGQPYKRGKDESYQRIYWSKKFSPIDSAYFWVRVRKWSSTHQSHSDWLYLRMLCIPNAGLKIVQVKEEWT